MRASYVNPPELLTPVGDWIAARLPHVQIADDHWHIGAKVTRVFGFRPHYRFQIYDSTRAWFYKGQPAWVRIRILGVTIYERNPHLSGLPNAARMGGRA